MAALFISPGRHLSFLPPSPAFIKSAVKYLILLVTVLALNSCNTLIGMGRDTKAGFLWTAKKIQGSGDGGGGGSSDNDGAPVY